VVSQFIEIVLTHQYRMCLKMAHNVLHIAEGGNFGAENLKLKQNV